jgi:hypothetical protein
MSKHRSQDSREGEHRPSSRITEDADESAYKVGYGRPPLRTRFPPGVSGNPKGRAKLSNYRNIKEEIQQVYLREIAVHDGNKTRRVSGIVLLFHKLLNDALKGDWRAALACYKIAADCGVLNIKDGSGLDLSVLTPAEREQCSKTLEILRKSRVLIR